MQYNCLKCHVFFLKFDQFSSKLTFLPTWVNSELFIKTSSPRSNQEKMVKKQFPYVIGMNKHKPLEMEISKL